MRKIPTMFDRDWDGDRSRVLPRVAAGCEWVAIGEGYATRKLDGTACLVRDGVLYKRHEVKPGREVPAGFEVVDSRLDDEGNEILTGWVPVGEGPEDKWHREAWMNGSGPPPDGTYELLGPKIQRNPEHCERHVLFPHAGAEILEDAPRDFDGLAGWFDGRDIEGIVWHHPDGRMAKIKGRDFGIRRAP